MSSQDVTILADKLRAASAKLPAAPAPEAQARNEDAGKVDKQSDPVETTATPATATPKQESGTDAKNPETATPEAKDQGTPGTEGEQEGSIQDIFKEMGFPNFGTSKKEAQQQPSTTPAPTAQGDWFESARKELGIESMTKEEWIAKQKSPQSTMSIPGLPDEVVDLLSKKLISINEVAAAGPLVDLSKIPNEDLLRDHFLGLDMTQEEADEAIEDMSTSQRTIEAAKIRKELKTTRESAFAKLKSQAQERATQEAAMKAQAMHGTIQAIESTTRAVVDALTKQTVEVAGVKMAPEEIADVARIVANPSELRKLVFSENDDPFEMGKRVWVLQNFEKISQKVQAAAKHEERKALIEKAAGFNPGQPNTPVATKTGGQENRTSAQKLQDALRSKK